MLASVVFVASFVLLRKLSGYAPPNALFAPVTSNTCLYLPLIFAIHASLGAAVAASDATSAPASDQGLTRSAPAPAIILPRKPRRGVDDGVMMSDMSPSDGWEGWWVTGPASGFRDVGSAHRHVELCGFARRERTFAVDPPNCLYTVARARQRYLARSRTCT